MSGCSLGTDYLLLAFSPSAILMYAVDALLAPIVWFLYRRNDDGVRRVRILLQSLRTWTEGQIVTKKVRS